LGIVKLSCFTLLAWAMVRPSLMVISETVILLKQETLPSSEGRVSHSLEPPEWPR
jgi:predicted transcriptional regulator